MLLFKMSCYRVGVFDYDLHQIMLGLTFLTCFHIVGTLSRISKSIFQHNSDESKNNDVKMRAGHFRANTVE